MSFRNVSAAAAAITRYKNFSCRDQFLAMAFAQLTYRESLRDIETCLQSIGSKLYHMGFQKQGGTILWFAKTSAETQNGAVHGGIRVNTIIGSIQQEEEISWTVVVTGAPIIEGCQSLS